MGRQSNAGPSESSDAPSANLDVDAAAAMDALANGADGDSGDAAADPVVLEPSELPDGTVGIGVTEGVAAAPAEVLSLEPEDYVVAPRNTIHHGKVHYGPGQTVPFTETEVDELMYLVEKGVLIAK